MKLRNKIKPLVQGDAVTLLSAAKANELVQSINFLLGLQPGAGITFTEADGNIIVGLDNGAGGFGSLNFLGQWVDQDYLKDSVVILATVDDLDDGTVAGTYVALSNVITGTPMPGTSGSEAYWSLLAKGWWSKLTIKISGSNKTVIDGGTLTSTTRHQVGASSGGGCIIDVGACGGKDLAVREVDWCEGGIIGKRRIVASDFYVP